MKKTFFAIIVFIFTSIAFAQADQTKIYVNSFYEGSEEQKQNAETKLAAFEIYVAIKLEEVYKCSKVNTSFEVKSALKHFRDDQILGFDQSSNSARWSNIASNTLCKFLVALKIKLINQTAILKLVFMDNIKAKTLFITSTTLSISSIDQTTYEKLTKELLEGLKQYEICPFKGSINVKVVNDFKDEQKEEYPVYCNGMDGVYKKTTSIKNYSEIDWSIEKTKLNAAKGNVNVNLSEETIIEEMNSCFECAPNKVGSRVFNSKTNSYSTVQGLSKESESEGVKVDDARVELTFLDDGTYTLRVKAASNKSVKKTVKEITAQGICQNINKREPTTNNIDLPLNELYGPFQGNAQDKILSQRGTFERVGPNTNQKETVTFEFNLIRD